MADSAEPPYVDDAEEDDGGTEGEEGEDQAFDAASVETAPLETSVEANDVLGAVPSDDVAVDSKPADAPREAAIESHAESVPADGPEQPLPPERVGD